MTKFLKLPSVNTQGNFAGRCSGKEQLIWGQKYVVFEELDSVIYVLG